MSQETIFSPQAHTCTGTVVRKIQCVQGNPSSSALLDTVSGSEGEVKAVGLEREEETSCSTLRCWNFILEVSRSVAQGPPAQRDCPT